MGMNYKLHTTIGTGSAMTIDGEASGGFRPKKVVVRNRTSRIMLEWLEGMEDGSAYKTVANGTRTSITSNGITPLNYGFTLGTDSVNGSGETLDFEVVG